MIADVHTFKVKHPKDGAGAEWQEIDFHFMSPVTRTEARRQVERVEGYVIQPKPRKAHTRISKNGKIQYIHGRK